jgi:RNA polymerase sigma factor, sigma-70 family
MLKEEEIINKVKEGDIQAFEELFELYKAGAKRLAYMITGNLADSEDIVQDAFIQCYRKINRLKENDHFRAWFYHTITRIAWKYCRYHKVVLSVDDISDTDIMKEIPDNSAAERLLKNEESEILYQAIRNLDKKQRTAVILYYYNEFSINEISTIMGCSEGTIKSRLHTARKNLKKALNSRENMEMEMSDHAGIKAV